MSGLEVAALYSHRCVYITAKCNGFVVVGDNDSVLYAVCFIHIDMNIVLYLKTRKLPIKNDG
jgi:hypothetical protein